MPLPLGHVAIGIATHETFKGQREESLWWKTYLMVAVLANLPDLDVVAGLFVKGNGWIYHRGLTHSMAFCLLGGIVAACAWRFWSALPKMGFWGGFAVTFSHVAADFFRSDTAVSLFWPFQVAAVSGHIGWGETLDSILFDMHQDADLIAGSLLVVFLVSWFRRKVRPMAISPSRKAAFGSPR